MRCSSRDLVDRAGPRLCPLALSFRVAGLSGQSRRGDVVARPRAANGSETARAPLPELDPLADRNRGGLRLRWNTDPWFWGRRLEAANAADHRRLWQTTYAGVQRLASLSRPAVPA